MNQYCRHISKFHLFKEFRPGEFKIVDFFREHLIEDEEKLSHAFLNKLRQVDTKIRMHFRADQNYVNVTPSDIYMAVHKSKIRLDCNPDEFHDMLSLNKEELYEILKILKARNFIHANFVRSFFFFEFATITSSKREGLCTEYKFALPDLIKADWELYEKIKPITDNDLGKIFEILRLLSPSQFEVLQHFIFTIDRCYLYTDLERETLNIALYNASELHGPIHDVLYS